MDHSKELFELMLLTYTSSLTHTKLSIKMKLESPSLMDSSCNCLNLTDIDELIQKATNIEQKLMYLREHRDYFIGNKKASNATACQSVQTGKNKTIKEEKENENNDYVKLEISDKNKIVNNRTNLEENGKEVVEVNKNDVLKKEIRTKLIKEMREKLLNILVTE